MINRKIIMAVMATSLSLAAAFPALAGWQQDQLGWRYESNGVYTSTEWKKINNYWYHFGQDGYMNTGWLDDGQRYYLNSDGVMLTGEQIISGKAYTFSQDGRLLREGIHRDGMEDDLITEAVVSTNLHWNDILYALQLVNQERAKVGARALEIDYDLSVVASYRAAHMNKYNYFSHYIDSIFVADNDAVAYTGKQNYLKENIWLYGSINNPNNGVIKTETSEQIVQMAHKDYVNSSGHYQTMISADSTKVGIGFFENNVSTRAYITMLFK